MKLQTTCSVNNITFLTSLIALSLSTFFLLDWHVFAEASRVILSGKDSIYRDNDQTHVSYTSVLPTTRLRVIPGTGLFTDGDSTYLFHGINVVYKGHNPVVVTPELVQFIIEHGFNAIRLGFLWTDVQPTYDYFNTTYLEILRNDIDELWSHGIRVILDLHQDCYSSYFCAQYDSLPDFITHPPNTTEYNQNGSRAFPLPMMHPKYDDAAEVDPSNPWGRITNCQELKKNGPLGWSSCYATFAMGKSTQRLYDNDDGAQDMFAEFWGRIAAYFKGHPGIVGYELLNEPWLGDVPLRVQDFNAVTNRKHWNLWSSGVADKKNLQPMYDRLQKAIREVDAEAVIFFEPATGGNILHAFPVGFEHGPGGSHYDVGGYNVLSYHVYCPWVQRGTDSLTDSKIKNWLKVQVAKLCEPMNGAQYAIRKHDIDRLQVGGWLTEFGNFPTDGRSHGLMNFVLSKMDEYFQSWSYWLNVFHNGTILEDISYRQLVRPYPMITWGRPETLKFDNRTMVMTYTFHTPRNPTSSNVTAIFLPPPAAGLAQHWSVDVTPDLFRGSLDVERSIYLLQPADDVATLGIEVSVTVLPAIIPPHWKLQ